MIDNFKYYPTNGTGSSIYQNNPSNLPIYGRLYTWDAANLNKSKIKMILPRIVNGVVGANYTIYGRLPRIDDLQDLFETTAIGNLHENGVTPDAPLYSNLTNPKLYYDAFLAGREDAAGDFTKAYPTLAGWRDNLPLIPGNTEYNDLTMSGTFWTNIAVGTDAHTPLSIANDEYMWSAYLNCGCANGYGFSVRYVFEPIYVTQ